MFNCQREMVSGNRDDLSLNNFQNMPPPRNEVACSSYAVSSTWQNMANVSNNVIPFPFNRPEGVYRPRNSSKPKKTLTKSRVFTAGDLASIHFMLKSGDKTLDSLSQEINVSFSTFSKYFYSNGNIKEHGMRLIRVESPLFLSHIVNRRHMQR